MNGPTRRDILRGFGTAAGCFAATASGLAFLPHIRPAAAQDASSRVSFAQGVASADPAPDGVILWTRAAPLIPQVQPVALAVQVCADVRFQTVLLEQPVFADAENDFTVRVTVRGLAPDTWYFYRFVSPGGEVSRVGRTRTAPVAESIRQLNLALASCQNYEQGFFGAWARMVADDEAAPEDKRIDAVLHLGDFIYETTPDLPEGVEPVRHIPPFPDGATLPDGRDYAVTAGDYRHLYKSYLEDEALQAARARWPFIATWDDHEFTNDSWQSYSTYPGAEGPAQQRKVAANRAWFEYMPARLDPPAHPFRPTDVSDSEGGELAEGYHVANEANEAALTSLTIYRSLEWGRTAEIIVADARSYRAPQPMDTELEEAIGAPAPPTDVIRMLDEGASANGGNPPLVFEGKDGVEVANPRAQAPAASVLGSEQKAWFKRRLKESPAAWKLWGNSIPAMPLRLNLSDIPFQGLPDVALGTDAWNGYPGELRELMQFVRDEKIAGVVSCAGDYHMHGVAILTTDPDADDPQGAAIEFATAGISSLSMFSGAERITRGPDDPFRPMVVADGQEGEILENFNLLLMQGVRAALAMNLTGSETLSSFLSNDEANPYLRFMDTHANGYVVLRVTPEAVEGEIVTVENAHDTQVSSSSAEVLRRTSLTAVAWPGGESPVLEGPTFTGKPPFPFA